MNAADKKLKAELTAIHGPIAFAVVQRLGAVACTLPTEERYLEFVSAIGDPGESSGVAREQLAFELLVHPAEPQQKARARKFLQAMPALAHALSQAIEALSCGDYAESDLPEEKRADLDKNWEFGWKAITPQGFVPIVLATDPTAGALARGVLDARERGDDDLGERMRTAVLSFVRSPEQDAVEEILAKRPALLMPLWLRCQQLAGVGAIELGKD
ncbi:MAG TPA: hypothetical protein VLH09_09265 [Bryobacteraceae bacterium]|nr:hypothetical protein [Bryobacteraceae bacterium]